MQIMYVCMCICMYVYVVYKLYISVYVQYINCVKSEYLPQLKLIKIKLQIDIHNIVL